MHQRLLILDDDVLFCEAMSDVFRKDPVHVSIAHTLAEARAACSAPFDVMFVDHRLPDGFGTELITEIDTGPSARSVYLVTGQEHIELPSLGRFDGVLTKPIDIQMVRAQVLQRSMTLGRVSSSIPEWIGQSDAFLALQAEAKRASAHAAPILITGETGTGKGALARFIHEHSAVASGPFVKVNCAALPESLIESELFGVSRGAFTGAVESRAGAFERAHGGTLFLDEVGDLPLHQQAKLLSILDDFTVRRLGAVEDRPVSVRVIAATNIDLETAVAERRFRADLFYRLGVLPLAVPALRERSEDIGLLAEYFLRRHARRIDVGLADGEAERLTLHRWPGNVRELENCMQRVLVAQTGPEFRPSKILTRLSTESNRRTGEASFLSLAEVERLHIMKTLHEVDDCRAQAAQRLGISVATLRRKLKTYEINLIDTGHASRSF